MLDALSSARQWRRGLAVLEQLSRAQRAAKRKRKLLTRAEVDAMRSQQQGGELESNAAPDSDSASGMDGTIASALDADPAAVRVALERRLAEEEEEATKEEEEALAAEAARAATPALSPRELNALLNNCCSVLDALHRLGMPREIVSFDAVIGAVEKWQLGATTLALLSAEHERMLRAAAETMRPEETR